MRKLSLLLLIGLVTLTGCTFNPLSLFNVVQQPIADEPVVEAPLVGDAVHGEELYKHGKDDAPPCLSCHTLTAGSFSLGPELMGVRDRAASRIDGLSAGEYLRQSILEPDAYLVNGYRSMMYPKYGEHFSDQDLADLLAYIESL